MVLPPLEKSSPPATKTLPSLKIVAGAQLLEATIFPVTVQLSEVGSYNSATFVSVPPKRSTLSPSSIVF